MRGAETTVSQAKQRTKEKDTNPRAGDLIYTNTL